jgi:hypothetical protein
MIDWLLILSLGFNAYYKYFDYENQLIHATCVLLIMLSGLQIFAQFESCRDSIDLILQCIDAVKTFTLILLYFILCFSVFFYLERSDGNTLEPDDLSETRYIFWNAVKDTVHVVTAGLDFQDDADNPTIAAHFIIVYLITILMLNLLVGILSEKLGAITA